MNPRGLVIAYFIWLIVLANLSNLALLAVNSALLLLFFVLGRIGLGKTLSKLLGVLPFIGFIAVTTALGTPGKEVAQWEIGSWVLTLTAEGLAKGAVVLLRAGNCLLVVAWLIAYLGIRQFLHILQSFGLPLLFSQLADFILRYFSVLQEELKKMQIARKARNYNFKASILHKQALSTLTQLLGVLFLRAFKRGEQVHLAMLARGYNGRLPILPATKQAKGLWLSSLLVAWSGVLLLIDKGWLR